MAVDLDWTALAAAAASLDERLSGDFEAVDAPDGEARAAAALDLWVEAATAGDRARFARMLTRRGLDIRAVRPLLGPVRLKPDCALPGWIDQARPLLAALMAGNDGGRPCPAAARAGIPFADLLWPAVVEARRARGEPPAGLMSDAALEALDLSLLRGLSEVTGRSLFDSFDFYRRAGGGPAAGAPEGFGLAAGFAGALREGPLLNLIAARPVMLRLAATVRGQWVAAMGAFLARLAVDGARLERFLGAPAGMGGAGPVVAVDTDLSDPHEGGQRVMVLRFGNGARVVWKPRALAAEAAWHDLVRWCAAHGAPVRLGAAPVLDCGSHGWMGFVPQAPQLTAAAAPEFWRRAGGLLAVMHLLRGSDLHHENVHVADGVPVPVDLEAMLQPDLALVPEVEPALRADQAARRWLEGSVLAVGLLPREQRLAGRPVRTGALAAAGEETVGLSGWTAVNRDGMGFGTVTEPRPEGGIPITIDGRPVTPGAGAEDLVQGYRAMIGFLAVKRRALLAADGPLAGFATARIRHVLRSTSYYEQLRQAGRHPAAQTDGVAWSRHFERPIRMARWDLDDAPGADAGWGLLAPERAALLRDDVPVFTGRGAVDGCFAPDPAGGEAEVARGLLEPAVLPRLGARLDRLCREIEDHVGLIRQAMTGGEVPVLPPARPWAVPAGGFDPEAARAMVGAIAGRLAADAIRAGGAAAWIGTRMSADGRTLDAAVAGDDLYDGRTGIALFLAGVAATTGDAAPADLALAALAPLRHRLAQGLPEPAEGLRGIGGFEGWGGAVYGLTRIARLLDRPNLLEDARRAAARITPEAIAADRVLDMIGGAAGAICGLLALHRATGDAEVLARAVACGHHIPADGRCGWTGVAGHPLAGQSHGAAGIAQALAALSAATGEAGFAETARQGLAFETGLFDDTRSNWPDLRNPERIAFPVQWCHGATGIGFGRLAVLQALDARGVQRDLDHAVACTCNTTDGGRDNLCCGQAGRLSLLIQAARARGDGGLMQLADRRLAAWLARAGTPDGFILAGAGRHLRPGLMQGLAGVGQVLLERLHPRVITPVLALG
ncbi:type 2 lanthipeptide synthetase LanM [uncultured Tistrella sp.]|uniref:type 2 lanthipeptide synthetase LanM n=1 Tax=Tistrella mobilis TaxID=171437 RepID=UPI002622ED94|nr:type 2 lanthipeptide synthetase LanM [uncultured Tistrella sp.]